MGKIRVKAGAALLAVLTAALLACISAPPPTATPAPPLNATIAKWHNNHTAALSINYDIPVSRDRVAEVNAYALAQGVVMDYELVTGYPYQGERPVFSGPQDEKLLYLKSELLPQGFGYFGHGHNHIDHDALSYADALQSFQTCYATMQDWGLKPVAYAYPRGAGWEGETQRALAAAGFLSGRLQTTNPGQFYQIAGAETAPENWFALKSLEMQSINFDNCAGCINDNAELLPILEEALERTAWVILTYHNIGQPEGWGWYDLAEFKKDVKAVAARDFWNAPLNAVTLYAREREKAAISIAASGDYRTAAGRVELTLSDGLDNARFDQPLTILFDQPAEWIGWTFTVAQDGQAVGEFSFDTRRAMVSLQPNERPYQLRLKP